MSGSATGEGDVHPEGTYFDGTHVEVKARKKFASQRYMDQAVKAAEKRQLVPMLVQREDRRDFIVCFRLQDIESGAVVIEFHPSLTKFGEWDENEGVLVDFALTQPEDAA